MPDENPLQAISVRLPRDLYRTAKATAALEGIPLQSLIHEGIEREVARRQREDPPAPSV